MAVTTLYDDLGVAPDASPQELRTAYRRLARQLHPDLNDRAGNDDEMRRLNSAWAVLGDPSARERYDRSLRPMVRASLAEFEPAPSAAAPAMAAAGDSAPWVVAPDGPRPPWRWLRPSVLAVGVLVIIFIATAYAGPHPGAGPSPGVSTTMAGAPLAPADVTVPPAAAGQLSQSSNWLGKCLLALPGYDAIVPCSSHNDGLVVGQSGRSSDCGAGTTIHQLAGRTQFVCLIQ